MSDKKYRTDAQLKADLSFHKRRMFEHAMRAKAVQEEIDRRAGRPTNSGGYAPDTKIWGKP